MKIAVLSDLHFGPKNLLIPARKSEYGFVLLERAVRRLNQVVCPDVTLFLGDILDKGGVRGASDRLLEIKHILDKLRSPVILIPGNHDGNLRRFFDIFPQPADIVDVGNCRFLPFVDKDEPGYNASRSKRDQQRFAVAREGFNGKLIAVQHVPLFPAGMTDCPYNLTNSADVIAEMKKHGVSLCIGGHYHKGVDSFEHEGIVYVAAPAICETPFPFLVVETEGSKISINRHQLALPRTFAFSDRHIHTQFAYCSENMEMRKAVRLARDFGLSDIGFSEHSDHLAFPLEDCRNGRCHRDGVAAADPAKSRFDSYIRKAAFAGKQGVKIGLEVECDFHGKPVLKKEHADKLDFMIGAVHSVKSLASGERDLSRIEDDFLAILEKFLKTGFSALAHPFRIFRRAGKPVNPDLFMPVVKMLKATGTAAELNFHTNTPDPLFFKMCIEAGVPLTFGSDSHNLSEIGDFAAHLRMMEEIGYNGDLADIMFKWPQASERG